MVEPCADAGATCVARSMKARPTGTARAMREPVEPALPVRGAPAVPSGAITSAKFVVAYASTPRLVDEARGSPRSTGMPPQRANSARAASRRACACRSSGSRCRSPTWRAGRPGNPSSTCADRRPRRTCAARAVPARRASRKTAAMRTQSCGRTPCRAAVRARGSLEGRWLVSVKSARGRATRVRKRQWRPVESSKPEASIPRAALGNPAGNEPRRRGWTLCCRRRNARAAATTGAARMPRRGRGRRGHQPLSPGRARRRSSRWPTIAGRRPSPMDAGARRAPPLALARIDESHCIGCTLCIDACPVDAILGGPKRCTS